ncbi:fibrous sheath CABYR-binding protein isoform X2 [Triplophysa rosa]|nr:fibrous sheath CABYR-binding protein isoform X2 [Triplophysa rosa]XP_057213298.1 fibrous sheath CABYR-binding protein isoform X2 [Triplophysa rosa]XP_057213300.1 fibrous sheath CABYR-binding protein isoform X2 [Triplophysa rosa]
MNSDGQIVAASKPFHFIGKKENIIQAGRVVKSVGDRDVLVLYHQGDFYAIDVRCYHAGGPLHKGDIEQAQRSALEDQYGSFGKGAQGVCAVSPPVITRVPVAKTSELPPVVPVKTHVAAVDPVEVPAEITPEEPIVKEEIPATDDVKDDVLKAAEESTEAPVDPAVEEQPVIETADIVTASVTEVTASIDEPLPIPTESEIQDKDTAPVATEIRVVAEPVEAPEREVEAVTETPAEESLVIPAEKEAAAETISSVKPPTETSAVDVEPVVEASVDINKPVVEVVEEPAVELEVTSVEAEPGDIHTVTEVTEGAHATSEPEKVPVEAAVEPEPEQQAAPLEEHTPLVESTRGPVAEGFIVTESSLAVEAAIPETQIPETTTEAPEVSSQMLTETLPAPETVLVPKEIINDFVDNMNGCLAGAEVAIEG